MRVRIGIVVAAILLAGCATNRGEMRLDAAADTAIEAKAGAPTAFIDEIVDRREFQDEPSDPSIPSLKGGASNADASIKAKAIARKRNTYGMALGDIVLEGEQTVVSVTRDLLRSGLNGAGYRVVDERSELGADGIEVDVEIDKFWGWFTPGFWSVKMESRIETDLTVTEQGKSREVAVRAYGINKGQSGREANWIEAYSRTFDDYRKKVSEAF